MTQKKIYKEVQEYLKQGSKFVDLRYMVTLAWMVAALLGSQTTNQSGEVTFKVEPKKKIATKKDGGAFSKMSA